MSTPQTLTAAQLKSYILQRVGRVGVCFWVGGVSAALSPDPCSNALFGKWCSDNKDKNTVWQLELLFLAVCFLSRLIRRSCQMEAAAPEGRGSANIMGCCWALFSLSPSHCCRLVWVSVYEVVYVAKWIMAVLVIVLVQVCNSQRCLESTFTTIIHQIHNNPQ